VDTASRGAGLWTTVRAQPTGNEGTDGANEDTDGADEDTDDADEDTDGADEDTDVSG